MDPGSPGTVVGLSILAAEGFVAGFTIIFIISVILRDYHRTKKLDTKDQIQLALKVTSIVFTILMTYNEISKILQPDLSKTSHPSPLFAVGIVYCMCSCTWLASLQCFFYFIKIVHFQWDFIQWMKLRISSSVFWQIVVVQGLSLSVGFLRLLPYGTAHVSATNSSHNSSSYTTTGETIIYDYVTCLQLIVICPSHVLSTITTFITTAFLRRHINKMKDTKKNGEVHQYNHAVQIMLRYQFLCAVFYLGVFLYYFSAFTLYSVGYWINLTLVSSFIPTVNVLQILGTPQLRTTWKEMTSYFTPYRGVTPNKASVMASEGAEI